MKHAELKYPYCLSSLYDKTDTIADLYEDRDFIQPIWNEKFRRFEFSIIKKVAENEKS